MSVDVGLLRVKMQHGTSGVLKASRHNKRMLASHKDADPKLSQLNRRLRGPDTPEEVAALAKRLMSAAGIDKLKRKDNITAIEVITSLPVGSSIDPLSFSEDFVSFVEHRFGVRNILSADLHLDEAAPHCHVLVLPLANGRLDASGIVGGPKEVNALHTAFFAEVGLKYGLERPTPRLSGNARKIAAQRVIDDLLEHGDPIAISDVWDEACEAIRRYPEPYMKKRGIERPASSKPVKSFEQYALSTGVGPKTAAAEARRDWRLTQRTATPVGVEVGFDDQPLPCGGDAPVALTTPLPAAVQTPAAPQAAAKAQEAPASPWQASPEPMPTPPPIHRDVEDIQYVERDSTRPSDQWDGIRGEWRVPDLPAVQPQKAAAADGVARLLASMREST